MGNPATAPRELIARVYNAVELLTDEEFSGQEPRLVIEMSQQMLADIMRLGQLRPTETYVRRYCDVMDSPDTEAPAIAAAIDTMEDPA